MSDSNELILKANVTLMMTTVSEGNAVTKKVITTDDQSKLINAADGQLIKVDELENQTIFLNPIH